MRERPELCNKAAGGYGLYSAQHGRLNAAIQYHRDFALESASWVLGQVMGYHWNILIYRISLMQCTEMKPHSLMQCAVISR